MTSALRVYLDFQGGSGWEEITRYTSDSLTISHRACSDNFHYAINVANITLRYNASLFVRIKNASLAGTNILVLVTKREAEVDTNFFSGFFSPDVSLVYNGIDYLQEIKIEAEDFTSYLDVNVGQYVPAYENFQIMNATASGISIVHHLFTLAGLSHDLIDPTVVLSGTIEAFTCSEGATALSLLDTLLFEHEYTANWNEQGLFSPIRWIPVSGAIPVFEFNDTNILAEVSEGGGYVGVDGVSVDWFDVATASGIRLYTADLPYADDGSFAGYVILPGYYYPVETNKRWWEPRGTELRTVYQEYSMDGVKAKTSPYWERMMRIKASFDAGSSRVVVVSRSGGSAQYGDVSALVSDLLSTADFSDVLITKNHVVYDDTNGDIIRDLTNFYNKKAEIRYYNPGASTQDSIYYMHIDGDAVYKSAVNTYTAGDVSDAKKVIEYPSIFIFNEREAITIAQALLADAKLGGRAWTFQSEYRVAEGSYVNVDLLNGTIGSGIVLERTYDDLTQIFSYIVKATSYYVFVNESRDASIYPASPNYQMVRIEAQGASAVGAAREASIILDLSTYAIERSRVGLLTPPTIEMDSIYGYNNTDYAGRYRVEVAVSGTDYILGYESAADESHYEYTVPVTVSGLYVQRVRVGLYRSGAFDTLLKSAMVSVTAEASSAPLYWGALLSPPSEDYNENDFYFDNNVPISDGGYLRYWTGSLWDQATGIWPYWSQANALAMNDMTAWTRIYGATSIAAVAAMIENLTAQTAFVQNLFAQSITIPAGGSFQFYKGAGVNRTSVKMGDGNIDFLDSPDTSPATSETLQGRISRLGVGPLILLDGQFGMKVDAEWGDISTINGAASYTPAMLFTSNKELRIAYRRIADSYIVERIWSGTAWGAEFEVNGAESFDPSYVEESDGTIRITYTRVTTNYLVERTWDGDSWGDEDVINGAASGVPAYCQGKDGILRIAYVRGADGLIVERIWDGDSWGEETEITDAAASTPTFAAVSPSETRVAYRREADGYIVERIYAAGVWGDESEINTADSYYPSYLVAVNNELLITYNRAADSYIAMRELTASTWGGETVAMAAASSPSTSIQLIDGSIKIAYGLTATNYIYERTLQRYARIGAGIIDSGKSTDGRSEWELSGNGTLRQFGWGWIVGGGALDHSGTITFPNASYASILSARVDWHGYKSGSNPTSIHDSTTFISGYGTEGRIDSLTAMTASMKSSTNQASSVRFIYTYEVIGKV